MNTEQREQPANQILFARVRAAIGTDRKPSDARRLRQDAHEALDALLARLRTVEQERDASLAVNAALSRKHYEEREEWRERWQTAAQAHRSAEGEATDAMTELEVETTRRRAAEARVEALEAGFKAFDDSDGAIPSDAQWAAIVAARAVLAPSQHVDLAAGPVPDNERGLWEQAEIAVRQIVDEDEAVDVLLSLRRLGFAPSQQEEK